MAQSGILSAVGFAPENKWREAPLTLLSGANYGIGVTNQNPHRFWKLEPGGGIPPAPEIFVGDGEIDGDVDLTRTGKVAMTYNGGYSFKADGENLMYPLLGTMGRVVSTQIQTSNSTITTNMWRHIFTPNKLSNSFVVEEIFGDSQFGRLSGGVLFQRIEFDLSRIVMARVNLIPYRQVPNHYHNASDALTDYDFGATAAVIPSQMSVEKGDGTNTWTRTTTPGYIDVEQEQPTERWGTGPFVFAGMRNGTAITSAGIALGGAPDFATPNTAFLAVDGVAYAAAEILEGSTFYIERKIDSNMTAGSSYDPGSCTGGGIMIGGNINFLFSDLTILKAANRHSRFALNFRLVGVKPGSNGTHRYVMEVFMPNVRLTVPTGPSLPDGPMTINCEYRARKDPTLGYACLVMIQNTFDISRMGGMMYNGTAKPFGWVADMASDSASGAATVTFTTPKNIAAGDVHSFVESTINGGVAVQKTVSSVNYGTGVVTYTSNIGFIFPFATTVVTRVGPGGLGGWSNT
jgi:hypothetical protein